MSKASDYAKEREYAEKRAVQSWGYYDTQFRVTAKGNLDILVKNGNIEIPAHIALEIARWLLETFGENPIIEYSNGYGVVTGKR